MVFRETLEILKALQAPVRESKRQVPSSLHGQTGTPSFQGSAAGFRKSERTQHTMNTSRITAGAVCILALASLRAQGQTVSTLTVTPSPAFTLIGGPPLQFRTIATYSNGATQDVTSLATWTSDSPTVATVNAAGLASGIAVGVANVTATFAGRSIATTLAAQNVSPGLPTAVATVPVGTQPVAVALNPATGKVYVANSGSANVTVFDPATQTSTAVSVGQTPSGIAVNSITNRIYVANNGSNDVTVIDGAKDTTSSISARPPVQWPS